MKVLLPIALALVFSASLVTKASADPPHTYIIGPEDVLDIYVANHEELNRTLTVLEDGTITMAEVGTIQAAGKTPVEVAGTIKTALSRTRKLVEVYISAKEIHSRNVRAIGAFKIPGAYELKPGWRVMDLVDIAGGLTQKPNRIVGKIVRNHIQQIPLDTARADANRESEFNVPLERDDEVILDELEVKQPWILVIGSVLKPGQYELDEHSTALSLLTLAGGPAEKAELRRAFVTRNNTQLQLDLSKVQAGQPDPVASAFRFQPGDILNIPENEVHFAVMGQVGRPGAYPMPDTGQVTVIDALNLAGGSVGGNLSKAGVVRQVNGKATAIPCNIQKLLAGGDMSKNIVMQPNDILYVPAANNHQFNWGSVLAPFTLLGILGFHF